MKVLEKILKTKIMQRVMVMGKKLDMIDENNEYV